MNKYCIIVAGGKGKRMGEQLPKQFLLLQGKPILMHTLEAFSVAVPNIPLLLVLPAQFHSLWMELCRKHGFTVAHELIAGGKERFHSVQNALHTLFELFPVSADSAIAIHDGVRPLVSKELIQQAFVSVTSSKAVIPVIPVADSIRYVDKENHLNKPLSRERVFRVQTPQVFQASILKTAYLQEFQPRFTDDATVVEHAGYPVHLIPGDAKNIKITFPEDKVLANYWLTAKQRP